MLRPCRCLRRLLRLRRHHRRRRRHHHCTLTDVAQQQQQQQERQQQQQRICIPRTKEIIKNVTTFANQPAYYVNIGNGYWINNSTQPRSTRLKTISNVKPWRRPK